MQSIVNSVILSESKAKTYRVINSGDIAKKKTIFQESAENLDFEG
jgi:hypothetical protein